VGKKSSKRLWFGFGFAIIALVIVAVVLVLAARGNVSLLSEDTPQGIVQRFLTAVQDKDFPKAYSYLSLDERGVKITYADWLESVPAQILSPQSTWRATLNNAIVTDDKANVAVTMDTFRPEGPFTDPVRSQMVSFQLSKIGDSWFITSPPDLYWLY